MTAAKKLLDLSDPTLHDLEIENRRVLVVEDEPQLTEVYADILSHRKSLVASPPRSSRSAPSSQDSVTVSPALVKRPPPFELTICSSATEALSKVQEAIQKGRPFAMGFFDVLLNDKMDGIELVKRIFELDSSMHAVFVTAYQDRTVDSIHEVLGEAASERWDYLNKPFSEGEILQKARNTVTLWNLKRDRQAKAQALVEATKRIMMSERAMSVAAVSRSVGHEFGNILLQISGTAELNQNAEPEKMRKALGTILNASDTATKILDKFKGLSRPAQEFAKKEPGLLSDVIAEAEQLMEHQFEKQNIRFCKIKYDKTPIPMNRTSLVQVLVNILINATHAMPNGGQIDVAMETLGELVELRIRDYGPGIPQGQEEQIFEPFFSTKGDKGTGLGLAICKEIIEIEHAGSLKARNHPAKGAEFVIQLPLQRSSE